MLFRHLILLTMTMWLSIAHGSAPICAKLYTDKKAALSPVKEISASSRVMIEQIHASPLTRIFTDAQNTKIDWKTFEDFKILRTQVSSFADYVKNLSKENRELELASFKQHLETDPELKMLFEKMEAFQKLEYLPTQYEMRKKSVEEILSILKLLPQDFRPRIAKIAWDQRRKILDQQTDAWMEKHLKAFDEQMQTLGFKNYEEYVQQLRTLAETDPDLKQVLELFDQDQIFVGTNVRESGRFWLPKVGLQNVFVANTSAGGDTNKKDKRANIESSGTGISRQEYDLLDHEIKPKYGVLNNPPDGKFPMNTHGLGYGPDFYIIKKEFRDSRVSIYIGDSFSIPGYTNNYPAMGGSLANLSIPPSPKNWRGMFIPWERRLILAPMFKDVKETGVNSAMPPADINLNHIFKPGAINGQMFEVQIFGKIGLDQIESFVFRGTNPPSGEFLVELQKRNIKIFDGRNGQTIPWEPAK